MKLDCINEGVRFCLDKKIFWTGFKSVQDSTLLKSQVGWGPNKCYADFHCSESQLESFHPQEIASAIELVWQDIQRTQ